MDAAQRAPARALHHEHRGAMVACVPVIRFDSERERLAWLREPSYM